MTRDIDKIPRGEFIYFTISAVFLIGLLYGIKLLRDIREKL